MGREVGGSSELGTRVHLWQIHVDVRQNQYNIVKLKKKNLVEVIYWENNLLLIEGKNCDTFTT